MKHTYVGTAPTTLAHGQPVAFGDEVDLSKTRARENAHLIDAGRLVPAPKPSGAKPQGAVATPDNTGKEGDE